MLGKTGLQIGKWWLLGLAFSITWLASIPGARAADYILVPSIHAFAQHNDNIEFSRQDTLDDNIYTVVPGLKLNYDDMTTKLEADLKAQIDRYQQEDDFDNEFYNAKLDLKHNLTRRFRLNGKFEFTKDTTLESELSETGRIQFREDRYRYDAGAGVRYSLTELVDLSLNYRYNNVDYKSDTKVDYNRHQAWFSIGKLLKTQVDRIYVAPRYSLRDSDENRVDSYNLSFGWLHGLSETFKLRIEAGARYTENEDKDSNDTDYTWGGVVNFRFFKRTERSEVDLTYTRDLATTAEGTEVDVDKIRLYFSWLLTERFKADLDGKFYYTKDEKEDDNIYTRYFEIQPSLFYKMTEDSALVLEYTYSLEYDEEEAPNERAERNRIWLGVAFNFPYKP